MTQNKRTVVGLNTMQISHYGNAPLVLGYGEYLPTEFRSLELQEWGDYRALAIVDRDSPMAEQVHHLMTEGELRAHLAITLDRWRSTHPATREILNEDGVIERLAAFLGEANGE
jgi:hypothetical protein